MGVWEPDGMVCRVRPSWKPGVLEHPSFLQNHGKCTSEEKFFRLVVGHLTSRLKSSWPLPPAPPSLGVRNKKERDRELASSQKQAVCTPGAHLGFSFYVKPAHHWKPQYREVVLTFLAQSQQEPWLGTGRGGAASVTFHLPGWLPWWRLPSLLWLPL